MACPPPGSSPRATSTPRWPIDADVVAYFASSDYRYREAADDIARCLRAGKNVVTTSLVSFCYPPAAEPDLREMLEHACRDGRHHAVQQRRRARAGSTTSCRSCSAATCARIDKITMQEILDYAPIAQPDIMYDFMGFAYPPEYVTPLQEPGRLNRLWSPVVWGLAAALGLDPRPGRRHDGEVGDARDATRPRRDRCPRARSAAMWFRLVGIKDGEERIVLEHITRMGDHAAPDWPRHPSPLGGYRVILEGMPTYTVDIEMHGRGQQHAGPELRHLHATAQRDPRGRRRAAGHRVVARPADGRRRDDRRRVDRGDPVSGVFDDLDGKVVVVTGASRGVGRGIARYLAGCGAKLVVSARGAEGLAALSAELDELGARARRAHRRRRRPRRVNFALVDAAVDDVRHRRRRRRQRGRRRTRRCRVEDLTEADLDVAVRRVGQGHGVADAGGVPGDARPGTRPHRDVRVERRARTASPTYSAYSAAKEAIRAITRTAAAEWGRHGITVNSICPVSVRHHTPGLDDPEALAKFEQGFARQPVPRDGRLEEDIAPVVGFLLSDASAYVTGQTLMADGGRIMLR